MSLILVPDLTAVREHLLNLRIPFSNNLYQSLIRTMSGGTYIKCNVSDALVSVDIISDVEVVICILSFCKTDIRFNRCYSMTFERKEFVCWELTNFE